MIKKKDGTMSVLMILKNNKWVVSYAHTDKLVYMYVCK